MKLLDNCALVRHTKNTYLAIRLFFVTAGISLPFACICLRTQQGTDNHHEEAVLRGNKDFQSEGTCFPLLGSFPDLVETPSSKAGTPKIPGVEMAHTIL